MDQICEERHKRIDEKFVTQEKRINNHSGRIDKLEQDRAEDRTEIKNLCKQLKGLTDAIKFVGGPIIAGIIGFFFYAFQNLIIK